MRNIGASKSIPRTVWRLGKWGMSRRVGLLVALLWSNSAIAATYTVTSLGDGAGSCTGASPSFSCTTLRAAITAANETTTEDDTVQFSVSGTITIASTLPLITDTVVIDGGGAITIAGGGFDSLIFDDAETINSQLLNMGFSGSTGSATTVRVNNTSNVLVQGNTITMGVTTGSAILVGNSTNVTANNNIVTGGVYSINYYNTSSSPYLADATYSGAITNNTITGASSGIALYTANNILVNGNNVINSTGIGIRLGMQFDGPYGASNTTITNNTITGGNSSGVSVTGYGGGTQMGVFNGNLIQGNTIISNSGAGIRLPSTSLIQANGNVITGNTITGNGGDGVAITGANATDNIIYANTNISGNGGLGIDLADNGVSANDAGDADSGPNGLQNFPVITSIVGDTVKFVLDTSANASGFRIDFYSNPGGLDPTGYGEGQVWLGSCIVASPSATVPSSCNITGVSAATLRMTATRCLTPACTTGATSEFNGPSTTDLAITKTDGQTVYTTGQSLTYTIVVTNSGTTIVSDAIFTDPAVAGLSITGVTCGSPTPGSQCPAAGSATTALMQGTGIVIPVLAPGGSVTFSVTATATASSGDLSNTATIAAPVGVTEIAPANNTATDTDVGAGSITIVKVAVPNDAQDFAFTTTGTGLSNFSLDDDADATLSNTQTFTGLAAGSYTVTEAALAGWSLTNLVCVDPDNSSTVDVGARIATIDLDAGESITCTFTNTLQSVDLGVTKTVSPDTVASGEVVTYTLTVTNNGPGTASDVLLTDTPDPGLDCSTPSTTATCTATGGASCPGPSPATTVPVSSLTGAGITLPSVPMGGQVVVQMQCTAGASGSP